MQNQQHEQQSPLTGDTLLRFRVGPFRFCVPAIEVDSIIVPPELTVIPLNPPHSKGVFIHHGQMASAISLRSKFALEDHDDQNLGQLIVGPVDSGLAAFWVDEVYETLAATSLDWRTTPENVPHDAFETFAVFQDEVVMATTMQTLYDMPAERAGHILAGLRERYDLPEDLPPVAADDLRQATVVEKHDHETDGAAMVQATPVVDESLNSREPGGDLPARIDNPGGQAGEAGPVQSTGRVSRAVDTVSPGMAARDKGDIGVTRTNSPMAQRAGIMPPRPGRNPLHTARPPRPTGGTYSNAINRIRSGGAPNRQRESLPSGEAGMAGTKSGTNDRRFRLQRDVRTAAPAFEGRMPPNQRDDRPPRRDTLSDANNIDHRSGWRTLALPLLLLLLLLLLLAYWLWPEAEAPHTTDVSPGPVIGAMSGSEESVSPVPPTPETPATGPEATPSPGTNENEDEVFRLEGDQVTLTVERPAANAGTTDATGTEIVTPAYTEFVHTVVEGDTLWDIAARYLGDPFRYPELARLSRINNPDLIYPGDTVRIRKARQ